MTEDVEQQVIGFWRRCGLLVRSQGAHIVLFLTVNVIFGALGFLAPISIEYAATLSFVPALQKQLNAAGAYTFAIAFLASSISFVAVEYLDRDEVAQYRRSKVLLSAFAALIMIFCAVFSGSQTARALVEDPRPAQTRSDRNSVNSEARAPADVIDTSPSKPPTANEGSLTSLDYLQIITTALAVAVGLLLFLVFQYQAPNMQAQLAPYTKQTEAEAGTLMDGLAVGRGEKP